jgi:hypothetical protein
MGKCFSMKCEVKEKGLFDKNLKSAVLKQMHETIVIVAKKYKNKGLELDANCNDGWVLTATVASLEIDDPAKPKSMEAKIAIEGTSFGTGGGQKLAASGKGKATNIRANKLEDEAKLIVNDVLGDLMENKVIPAVLK